MPLVLRSQDPDHGFLTSVSTAATMLEQGAPNGMWLAPAADAMNSSDKEQTFIHVVLEHIKSTSKVVKALSTTAYVELTEADSNVLNQDWWEYPQLRYCCSQLLVGSILVQNETAILVNIVKPYARDPLIDAHDWKACHKRTLVFPKSPRTSWIFQRSIVARR